RGGRRRRLRRRGRRLGPPRLAPEDGRGAARLRGEFGRARVPESLDRPQRPGTGDSDAAQRADAARAGREPDVTVSALRVIPPGSTPVEARREGLRSKARENLALARFLLERGSVDAAAGRFYYAVFQAAVYALRRQGESPGDFRRRAREWDHGMVGRCISLVRGRPEDGVLFSALRHERERADYEDEPARRRDLEFMAPEASRFVDEATR